jgi:hypothetical protein
MYVKFDKEFELCELVNSIVGDNIKNVSSDRDTK